MAHKIVRVLAPIGVLLASIGAYAVLQATKPAPTQTTEQARPSRVNVALAAGGSSFPNVPPIVMMCIRHLEQYGLRTVGIFRVSSSKKRVRQVRVQLHPASEYEKL